MNQLLRPKYFLLFLFSFLAISVFAQTNQPSPEDGEFNPFLMSFAAFFICLMIAAAFIGAFFSTIFLLLLFGLISFGLISTSVAVGLYNRSVPAAFKTLLMLVFGAGCSVCGIGLSLVGRHFYPTLLSTQTALLTGLVSGAVGGMVMGLSTITVIQALLRNVFRKFIPA